MNERIKSLTKLTLDGKMYVFPTKTEFDRKDLFLEENERNVKRICEYIRNQEPLITEYSALTGFFRFDDSVVGDAFTRIGHKHSKEAFEKFYLKPIENLSTMEWQHATADYQNVLKNGINGIINQIDESMIKHTKSEEIEFLCGLKKVAKSLIDYTHKCSKKVEEFAETLENTESKKRLLKLSEAIKRVPENAPKTFYEAVLTIYICYSANPDSIGTADRYLSDFYKNDIKNGVITKDEAKEYLQELFLMLQAKTSPDSPYFQRGGESHFCIGGYLPDGTDAYDETSELILESLMELPVYCPQITFRWTKKTPRETFRHLMDCERKDKFKRIAFTNDEKRIKTYTEICGIPFKDAVNYTTVGCNEPVFCGSICGSNSKINAAVSMARLFNDMSEKIINIKTFDEFFDVYKKEMLTDLERGYDYDNKYNILRSRDINYVSSIFFNGPIKNAKSFTKGGCDYAFVSPMILGMINVIDSLCVVKQFVFDEKIFTMNELINAVKNNWNGYEDIRTLILNKGDFFGNDGKTSNEITKLYYDTLYEYLKDKKNVFGYPMLVGDLIGYNEHNKWFGEKTKATPDGRYDGEIIKFGLQQSEGKDKNGVSALLNSITVATSNGISCGNTITNINFDKKLILDDGYFEKTVDMLITYFKNGGVHFQLTYVSAEDLFAARKTPEKYKNLRVRVTGFSDYFVNLNDGHQKDIIKRTVKYN